MRAQYILAETYTNLRRNLTMAAAMIVTVAISLALLGAALLISDQVERMKGFWYDRVEVSVFLCGAASERCEGAVTAPERREIQEQLEALPAVRTVYYESQEEAYEHFSEQFKDSPELIENVKPSALPESYRVKLDDPEAFSTVAAAIAPAAGVEEVVDQKRVLERFFAVMNGFQTFFLWVAVLQLAVAAVLISNTVRVAAYSRRKEVGIMRLVGASNWSIRLPFLLEGVLAGIVGAGIASGALALVKYLLIDERLAESNAAIPFIGWSTVYATIPILLLIGVLLSGLASLFTIRRHLKV